MKKITFLIALVALLFASCSGQFTEQETQSTSITISAAQILPRTVTATSDYEMTLTMKYVDGSAADKVETISGNAGNTLDQSITFGGIEIGKTVQFECKAHTTTEYWYGKSDSVVIAATPKSVDLELKEADEKYDVVTDGIFNYPAFLKVLNDNNTTLDGVETFEIPDGYHTIDIGNRGWIFFEDPNKKDDAKTPGARELVELTIPKTIVKVGKDAFKMYYTQGSTPVIKYKGTLADWFKIEFLDMEDSHPMTWGQKLEMLANDTATTTTGISGDVTIPNYATIIPTGTFKNSKITSVTFEETSKLEKIGRWAFQNTKLTTIKIPASVKMIYPNAFNESSITSIEFENTTGWKLYTAEGATNYEKPAATGTDVTVTNASTNAANLKNANNAWRKGFLIHE